MSARERQNGIRRPTLLALSAALVLCVSPAPARAELTPAQEKQATALIRQFSARQFAVRQEAVKKLIALGPDVIPLVRKTLDETDDNEVRLRCRMTLDGLARKHGLPLTTKPSVGAKFGTNASRITINEIDTPLRDVVDLFAKRSGNRPIRVDRRAVETTVTFKVTNMPYWQALDKLCETAKLTLDYDVTPKKLAPRKDDDAKRATSYAGPAVVRVIKVLRAAKPDSKTKQSLTIDLRVACEDRLPLIGAEVTLTQLQTPDGKEHLPKLPGGRRHRVGTYKSRHSSMRTGWVILALTADAADVDGPFTLVGALELEFGTGAKDIRIDDVFAGVAKQAHGAATAITLIRALKDADGTVRISMKVKSADRFHRRLHMDSVRDYGFSLIDANGDRHATITSRMREGHLNRDGVTRLHLKFIDVPETKGRWALAFMVPAKVEKRSYPFTIENIPLR